MNLRSRLLGGTERILAGLLACTLFGAAAAFGGSAWWARPLLAALTAAWAVGLCFRALFEGRWRVLKSPLTGLGVLALGLALVQLAPLPPALASRLSPRARDLYSTGVPIVQARADDPSLSIPESTPSRSPSSLDRPATLRWLVGALGCLAIFGGVGHFVDRLGRVYLAWGSVVAAFGLNTAIVLVQLASGSGGLYGFIQPGDRSWAPSSGEMMATPNQVALRVIEPAADAPPGPHPAWALARPDRPFLVGTMPGGPGAYLALSALGLPMALGLVLQMLAPRGSREGLWSRLAASGRGSPAVLLVGVIASGSVATGIIAGPLYAAPIALAAILVGLPAARSSGLRWSVVGLTSATLLGLGLGAAASRSDWIPEPMRPADARREIRASLAVWREAAAMARDHPIVGIGLGAFGSVHPAYKGRDVAETTARSGVVRWCVESGAAGVGLAALAALWCLAKLPGAVRRVGTADRPLAYGMIGATCGFGLFSAIHWSADLAAISLAAGALGGTCNRWLAGGTDLFVDRG